MKRKRRVQNLEISYHINPKKIRKLLGPSASTASPTPPAGADLAMRSLIGGKELLLRTRHPRPRGGSRWQRCGKIMPCFFWQMDMTPQITTKIGKLWWFLGVNLMFFPWSINWAAILLGQFFCPNIVGKLEMPPLLSLSSLTTPLPTSWLVNFSIIGWESVIPLLISLPSYNWAGSSPLSRGACVTFAVRSGSGAALFGATLLGTVGQEKKMLFGGPQSRPKHGTI